MENLERIIKLVEAGFTKDEINAMLSPKAEPEKAPEEIPAESAEEPKDETSPQSEYVSAMKEITDELKKMKDELRRSALLRDDTQISDPLEEGRKVLASIIDPPNRRKEQ